MPQGVAIYNFQDAKKQARKMLPRLAFDYIQGDQEGRRDHFRGRTLVPKVLKGVVERNTNKTLLGRQYAKPFGIAPMGGANLAWPSTDRMMCQLARSTNMPIGASTVATSSLENYWDWSEGQAWFQLYVSGDGSLAKKLCQRAWAVGYRTLVLTVDVPVLGRRVNEKRNGFSLPFKMTAGAFFDFATHPRWSLTSLSAGSPTMGNFAEPYRSQGYEWARDESRAHVDMDWVRALRDNWTGSIIVKGVLSVEDALELQEIGVDAIQVSSHADRQLARTISPLTSLQHIRAAVGQDFPLLYDSGVQSGEDVLVALAFGADFVMIGKAWLFAAAAGQSQGLSAMYDLLSDELDIAMAMCGLKSLNNIPTNIVDAEA